jgi:acid phosphatase type 7
MAWVSSIPGTSVKSTFLESTTPTLFGRQTTREPIIQKRLQVNAQNVDGVDVKNLVRRSHATMTAGLLVLALLGSSTTSSQAKRTAKPKKVETVIGAVGDLVCDAETATSQTDCRQVEVSDAIVADKSIRALLLLGDLQYDTGELSGFTTGYEKTYGRLNNIAIPTPGNHEYGTENAAGYFTYFGAKVHPETSGYYSTDLSASWHVVVLNSNCDFIGGCGKQSAQMKWLEADLAANKRPCTIAIWHHPLFTSAERGPNTFMRPLWDALDAAKVDLVLAGHEHQYERFAPQRGDGSAASNGIRQFVVGTGGKSIYPFAKPTANSQFRATGFGFLRLELLASGYNWRFINQQASDQPVPAIADSGSAICH